MGRNTRGIYPDKEGTWQVDKYWRGTRLRQRGFPSFAEADRWLIRQLDQLRAVAIHGERPVRTFDEAAAHYLLTHQGKVSIETDTYLLQHTSCRSSANCSFTRCMTAPSPHSLRSDWASAVRTRP